MRQRPRSNLEVGAMNIVKSCLRCQKQFEIHKSRADRARFCSRECRYDIPLEERLRVVGHDVSERGCWIWRGTTNDDGYGKLKYQNRAISVHRASWQINRGPIPVGMTVLHSCDVRPCFNPEHLFLGTQADNISDMDAKGRRYVLRGEENGFSALTDDQVRDILSRPRGVGTGVKLAEEFGVSQTTISRIRLGKRWAHVG
jgi:hypothetical protein